ncbi:septal ring lytic transglycosylase RlpA family protein [Flavobacterium agrisoli]|uniref:Probable endolytic peptidoglycan transglycosylase RlpA n=1 Tax=Flavobacterium agrisoli TaxID=2793066 RepID=A0A934UJH5_9FLAO|nr:septal ring lytic transglycosylase RlpA family protein [Flavobacterium agrisoli]MBK0369584.1 septal ring lytic transglycosylase RlpA family protein [Flavobacterium agrisoli]
MKHKKNLFQWLISLLLLVFSITYLYCQAKPTAQPIKQDSVKMSKIKTAIFDKDTTIILEKPLKLKLYQKSAHASYYADRFNGKRTASGTKFDNNKYTAAHKKLPFGTKVKVTNELNGKSVIVEITDRGPFVKTRDIDLSKRAFMDIVKRNGAGIMTVTIEIIED